MLPRPARGMVRVHPVQEWRQAACRFVQPVDAHVLEIGVFQIVKGPRIGAVTLGVGVTQIDMCHTGFTKKSPKHIPVLRPKAVIITVLRVFLVVVPVFRGIGVPVVVAVRAAAVRIAVAERTVEGEYVVDRPPRPERNLRVETSREVVPLSPYAVAKVDIVKARKRSESPRGENTLSSICPR